MEKNKEVQATWRMDALQKLLKEIHSLFLMFHGPIRLLLEKEPTGEVSRSHLYSFIMDYLSGKSFTATFHLNYLFMKSSICYRCVKTLHYKLLIVSMSKTVCIG